MHNNPDFLQSFVDRWPTKLGAWFPGERVVYRGHDLLHGLKNMSWMGLLLLGITGRNFSETQIKIFEGIWTIGGSFPDPRLWNNRVAALAGSCKSSASLATAAGISVSEATVYGQGALIKTIDFLFRTQKKLDEGFDLSLIIDAELERHRSVFGYGRPIVNRDERIIAYQGLAERHNVSNGCYLQLAFKIEKTLLKMRLRRKINAAAVAAALAADQGMDTREFAAYMTMAFTAGLLPCYGDAVRSPAGTLFPLTVDRIDYTGVSTRSWQNC